jgi:hypothetical protein
MVFAVVGTSPCAERKMMGILHPALFLELRPCHFRHMDVKYNTAMFLAFIGTQEVPG